LGEIGRFDALKVSILEVFAFKSVQLGLGIVNAWDSGTVLPTRRAKERSFYLKCVFL
jgi:hypothetical protein